MRFKQKEQKNLLTMTPVLKKRYQLEQTRSELSGLRLIIPRNNWLERLSVRFLNQPEAIKVRLDELGSFVLTRCDGKWNVNEIATGLEGEFGENAKPILPRLVKYLQMVEMNGWIFWESER
ncbi:MAG TPA: PqqD family protein [Bacillales bacterium]|nr:PqqD family protein [Bacillales bacterium]